MRKIIDNRIYDTKTAKCIASHNSGLPPHDSDYWSTRLYRTKKGNYFLEYCDYDTEELDLLTPTDVIRWLKKFNFCELAEKLFSELEEG